MNDTNEHQNNPQIDVDYSIQKAIKPNDVFISFYRLKNIYIPDNCVIKKETMHMLYQMIQGYPKTPFTSSFYTFMADLLNKVECEDMETHILCLSFIPNLKHDILIDKFSHSNIFSFFKYKISNMFTKGLEPGILELLIKLLNSDRLVLKHIEPVISKLRVYVESKIIDRNIIECCMLLKALDNACFLFLRDKFISMIIEYLVRFLYNPETYQSVTFSDSKIVLNTISFLLLGLPKCENNTLNIKNYCMQITNECIGEMNRYKHSTVPSEVLVVTNMVACLSPLLELLVLSGYSIPNELTPELVSFNIFDRKPKNKITHDRVLVSFNKPFSGHNNMTYQLLTEAFYMNKYCFLNTYAQYETLKFNRIEFLNDLTNIENPDQVFGDLQNIKACLDWSDIIVYACNAPVKENYIQLLFDDLYLQIKAHNSFIEIYLKNIKNDYNALIYFTRCAIDKKLVHLLPTLYLLHLSKDIQIVKKRRLMILEYLNGESDSLAPIKTDITAKEHKELVVNIETLKIDHEKIQEHKNIDITVSKPIELKVKRELEMLNFDNDKSNPEIQVFVDKLTSEIKQIHTNLIPLLIILVGNKIENKHLENFLTILHQLISKGGLQKQGISEAVVLFTLFCNINKCEFFKNTKMTSYVDLLIADLCIEQGLYSDEYIGMLKREGFDILITLNGKEFKTIKEVKNHKSMYLVQYYRLLWLITNDKGFLEQSAKYKTETIKTKLENQK